MPLPEPLAKAFRRLFDHYDRVEEERGKAKPSGQSSTEYAINARAMRGRHLPYLVRHRFPDGSWSRVLWADEGIRCGTIYVGQGDEHPKEPPSLRTHNQPQLARPDAVRTALASLDAHTRLLLEQLARDPLPEWRVPFGEPFKAEGGERYRAPLLGVMKEPPRGPGNVAQWTPLAVRRFGWRAAQDLDTLGRLLQERRGVAADRELARAIKPQAWKLAIAALEAFSEAMVATPRLPAAIVRVGNG